MACAVIPVATAGGAMVRAAGKAGDAVDAVADTAKAVDYVGDAVKSASKAKPNQIHHFATNKSKTYTHQFEEIVKKYGLDLDGVWNKEMLPHQGRHPNKYHDFVLENLKNIDDIANGDVNAFLEMFECNVKGIIRDNPEMLYKTFWNN